MEVFVTKNAVHNMSNAWVPFGDDGLGRRYTKIRDLSITLSADITGGTMPTNECSVKIYTTDRIVVGRWLVVCEDAETEPFIYDGELLMKPPRYQLIERIVYAESSGDGWVEVRTQSFERFFHQRTLKPVFYEGLNFETVMNAALSNAGVRAKYQMPQGYQINARVYGYFPEQTLRERLQWLMLMSGVRRYEGRSDYVDTRLVNRYPRQLSSADGYDGSYLHQRDEKVIPLQDTYWRPRITYGDTVTSLKLYEYRYAEVTEEEAESYRNVIEVLTWSPDANYNFGGSRIAYFVPNEEELYTEVVNTEAAATDLDNVVELDGITSLVSTSYDNYIVNALAPIYFNRATVSLECIDNDMQYRAGTYVNFCVDDEGTMMGGYVTQSTYTFGVQTKASLEIAGCEVVETGVLAVIFTWDEKTVETVEYHFPIGFTYRLSNPYLMFEWASHYYVLRPIEPELTETLEDEYEEHEVAMATALDYLDGDLTVISVDGAALETHYSSGEYHNVLTIE